MAVHTIACHTGAFGKTLTHRIAHPAIRHHNAMTAMSSTATGGPMTPTHAIVVVNKPIPNKYPSPAAARPVVVRTNRMSAVRPGMTRIHQPSGWKPVPVATPAVNAATPRSHEMRGR